MPSLHYSLPLLGVVLLGLFLAWHYRHLYVDRLPRSVSSRLRYYAPLTTFEDAAEQGEQRFPFLDPSVTYPLESRTDRTRPHEGRLLNLAL